MEEGGREEWVEARWKRHLSPESREQQEEGEQGWEIQRGREIYSQSVGAGMQQPRWVRGGAHADRHGGGERGRGRGAAARAAG